MKFRLFLWSITLLAALWPYGRLLTPNERVIPTVDYTGYQVPVREFLRDELALGRLPIWLPYASCGSPLLGMQQSTVFYPLSTPFLVFGANYGLKVSLFIHIALGFVGTYFLARHWQLAELGALFAAVAYSQSGFVVSHLCAGHVNLIWEYGLIPWWWLAFTQILEQPGARPAAWLALVSALLMLAGHPQLTYYTFLIGAAWALIHFVWRRSLRYAGRRLGWGTLASCVAILLSACQILPVLELYRDGASRSERGGIEMADYGALRTLDLLSLLSPQATGNPYCGVPVYTGQQNLYHERTGYVGLVSLGLALIAATNRGNGWIRGAAITWILGILFSLGVNGPLFEPLGTIIPGVFIFRCPGRVFGATTVFIAVLAGRGFDVLSGNAKWSRTGLAIVSGVAIFLLATVGISVYRDWAGYQPYLNSHWEPIVTLPVMLGVNTILALLLVRLYCYRPVVSLVGALIVLTVDLGFAHTGGFSLATHQTLAAPPDVQRYVDAIGYPQVDDGNLRYSNRLDIATRNQVMSLNTHDGGLQPCATENLFRAVIKNPEIATRCASCDYVLRGDKWEQQIAVPRSRFVSKVNEEVLDVPLERLRSDEMARMESAVMVTIDTEAPREITLRIDANEPGWLVLADTDYPGWVCEVDELETPILSANGVFRRVAVAAGEHRVRFQYAPASLRYGLVGTSLGTILWFGLVLLPGLQRKSE